MRPRPAVANPPPKRREMSDRVLPSPSCRARPFFTRLRCRSRPVLIQKEASGKPSCARKTSIENRLESNLHAAVDERERRPRLEGLRRVPRDARARIVELGVPREQPHQRRAEVARRRARAMAAAMAAAMAKILASHCSRDLGRLGQATATTVAAQPMAVMPPAATTSAAGL